MVLIHSFSKLAIARHAINLRSNTSCHVDKERCRHFAAVNDYHLYNFRALRVLRPAMPAIAHPWTIKTSAAFAGTLFADEWGLW